jgi:hypothetical protein
MGWVEGIGRCALAAATLLALPAMAEESKPANDLREIARQIELATEGKSLLGASVAPAEALDAKASKPDRIAATNKRIITEIDQVVGAFHSAPDDLKEQAARAVVHKLDIQTAANGASRVFEGDGPSQSIMRQFLVLPAASLGEDPVGRATEIVTSFEHSPKTDDNYYEYSNPRDFAGSTIRDLPGSATSWNKAAQAPLAADQAVALKKCRHVPILGWYCNTAVYGRVALEGGETQLLISALRPVAKGSDNAKFTDDRAKNTADGSTAIYVITRSGPSVLIYNLGFQTTRSAPSLQSKLNEGHKLEYRQLVQRFAMDGVK